VRRINASGDQYAASVSRFPHHGEQQTPGDSHSLYSKQLVDDSQTNLLYGEKRQLVTTADQTSDLTQERQRAMML